MRHGSLFSGIGGFDLAAEWMGWENVFHCEWNEFGKRVLKYYWPKAISYDDITKTDFTKHKGEIDIISGGFPCQPYSQAGKRLGKEDDRHLWPEMLRAIREIQPRYVVGENVRGLTNWNGGLVFDEVQTEMEAEGYEVTPFYFQLQVSTLPIEETEFGLLPTPRAVEISEATDCEIVNGRAVRRVSGNTFGINITTLANKGLLPTPQATEAEKGSKSDHQNSLTRMVKRGELLSTPTNSMVTYQDFEQAKHHSSKRPKYSEIEPPGKTSRLNPLFVAEMMGFPSDWTELPFLNGGANQSKHTETQ